MDYGPHAHGEMDYGYKRWEKRARGYASKGNENELGADEKDKLIG